jgi:hypothetical protein
VGLILFKKFLDTTDDRLLVYAVLSISIGSYARASGLSLCFAIAVIAFLKFRFRWQFFLTLLSFVPILSFFFYQWLFFGITNYYLKNENFFSNLDVQTLKFKIGELIFYMPSETIFYLLDDKNEWLLSKLYAPIIWFTKSTRLDWMGVLSILFWCVVFVQGVKRILNKEYLLPLYLFVFILLFVFHTCPPGCGGCADPRLFFQVLPVMLLLFVEFLVSIKNLYVKKFLLFSFIGAYTIFNIYGIVKNDKEMLSFSKRDIASVDISTCLVDNSSRNVNVGGAEMFLFKLCFNKGYGYFDKSKIGEYKGKNLLIYTQDESSFQTMGNIRILKKLPLKNSVYLLVVFVNE